MDIQAIEHYLNMMHQNIMNLHLKRSIITLNAIC